jgi:tight adherence protein B
LATVSGTTLAAMLAVGAGLALVVVGLLNRLYRREEQLADILDLPYGDSDVDVSSAVEQHSVIVDSTVDFAARVIAQVDAKGQLRRKLERARIPMKPGEYAVVVLSGGVLLGALLAAITGTLVLVLVGIAVSPFCGKAFLEWRVSHRTKAFEQQFPDALDLISSSLSAGHTFLRAIQLMCEESPPPISEEFARVVSETQLGGSLVDALERMATRLDIRDVDWVVQAIRIQQSIGGRLADLLQTLSEFIRAREEVRREVLVLTAEGRISAWILGGLPIALFLAVQVIDPGYMKPMMQGWGWMWLGITAASVALGVVLILRMVKIEV